ncbi:MAG: ubiquinone/menaquinone biosynthesis methyltransferase [Thermoanaerobaculia bacterium]
MTAATPRTDLPALDKSSSAIRGMFGRIAWRYDLMNRLVSGGLDRSWRMKAAAALACAPGERVLDVGSGTGDLALALNRQARGGVQITALDFTYEMLSVGRTKFSGAAARIPETAADGLRLPFPDGVFDAAMAAFSVRNFASLGAGAREILRVLKPGGRLLVLELTPAPTGPLAPLILFWSRRVVPALGAFLARDAGAYRYLPDSVGRWPRPDELARQFEEAGFERVSVQLLTFGIAAIHLAIAPVAPPAGAAHPESNT